MKAQDLKIHRHSGKYNFKEWEIREMKDNIPIRYMSEIAPRQSQIAALKDQIKTLQKHIDAAQDTNMQDSQRLERGWENRVQECYRLKNWDKRCFQFFAVESQILLYTENFGAFDNQTEAFETGDLQPINNEADAVKYTRTLYWEGKLYSFGPMLHIFEDDQQPTEEEAAAAILALNESNTADRQSNDTERPGMETIERYAIENFPNLHTRDEKGEGPTYVDSCPELTAKEVADHCDPLLPSHTAKKMKDFREKWPELTDEDIRQCLNWAELPF